MSPVHHVNFRIAIQELIPLSKSLLAKEVPTSFKLLYKLGHKLSEAQVKQNGRIIRVVSKNHLSRIAGGCGIHVDAEQRLATIVGECNPLRIVDILLSDRRITC